MSKDDDNSAKPPASVGRRWRTAAVILASLMLAHLIWDGLGLAAPPSDLPRDVGIVMPTDPAAVVVRVYDVRPLLDAADARYEPPPVTGDFAPPVDPPTDPVDVRADRLRQLIQQTVQPYSWKDVGGNVGTLSLWAGQLVVTHTPSAQQEVVNLLRRLQTRRKP